MFWSIINDYCVKSKKNRGNKMKKFTLLELLIVVAIIGILVSILMPSLHKARQKARAAVCLSNTKQIGLAWNMYLDNSGGAFWEYISVAGEAKMWPGYLKDFTSPDIHNCPEVISEDTSTVIGHSFGTAQSRWVDARGASVYPWNTSSYGYNLSLVINNFNEFSGYKTIDSIDSPNEVPFIGDAIWRSAKRKMSNINLRVVPLDLLDPENSANIDSTSCKLYRFITNRHGKVTVMSFVDGSSRLLSYENVFRQQWHSEWDKDLDVINPH